jgi:hypothetical protein
LLHAFALLLPHNNHLEASFQADVVERRREQDCSIIHDSALKSVVVKVIPINFVAIDLLPPTSARTLLADIEILHVGIFPELGDAKERHFFDSIKKTLFGKIRIHNKMTFFLPQQWENLLNMPRIA